MNIEKYNYTVVTISKKISYYDLLTILKSNMIPYRIKYNVGKYSTIYYYDEENTSYLLENKSDESQRFNYYLIDNFTDMGCFNKCIELL